ncbi:hypothetical protein C8J57DRAFT_964742, partial [Mycena rebaudengoi]
EERIQLAVKSVQKRERSVRGAAKYFRVPRTTLDRRLCGVQTRTEAHEHERALSLAQEDVLTEW